MGHRLCTHDRPRAEGVFLCIALSFQRIAMDILVRDTDTPSRDDDRRAEDRYVVPIRLQVNGRERELTIDPRVSLLDALREYLHLTGTKKGCDQGACGACTVLVDGVRILSCLALAVQYADRRVTTVEGLADDGALHPLQAAFITHDGFQCGYCTSGQICSAVGMATEFRAGVPSAVSPDVSGGVLEWTDEEIKERMSGNLCRCGAYVGICDAVRESFADGVIR
jgi:xanthine dehydrogenase YagT iron-sulfur-binding subunit